MDDSSIAEQGHYGEVMARPFISKRMKKQKCHSLACQLPVDVKFRITDLFGLTGSSFLYFFMNPIDSSGESSPAIVNGKWCPLAREPFLSSHLLGRPSDELLVSELS